MLNGEQIADILMKERVRWNAPDTRSRHERFGHPIPQPHCPQCINVYGQRALNEKHARARQGDAQ